MTISILNPSPYLRTSRSFPQEAPLLSVQLTKAYIDIAQTINARTIGLFATTSPQINGESWFIVENQRQQGFRQLFTFTAAGNVAHGLNFANLTQFTKCSGSYTDGTNWYGAIFGTSVAIAGQVSFYITSMDIVILSGAGAPAITSGTIVLEWLSNA